MTPNTENIEALLCAYIEGDLDDTALCRSSSIWPLIRSIAS